MINEKLKKKEKKKRHEKYQYELRVVDRLILRLVGHFKNYINRLNK